MHIHIFIFDVLENIEHPDVSIRTSKVFIRAFLYKTFPRGMSTMHNAFGVKKEIFTFLT